MPTQIQVMNRYVLGDPVVGAAITFDHDNEDAKTPRTAPNGFVTVRTEDLTDGNHVVRIAPRYTSDLQVGPDIAEDLEVSVTRMFRSLELGITVLKGKVQSVFSLPGQQSRGTVAAGTNPVRVLLQPIYHRSPHQNPNFRTPEKITLIVVHQTAGSTNIGGTLNPSTAPYGVRAKRTRSAKRCAGAAAASSASPEREPSGPGQACIERAPL